MFRLRKYISLLLVFTLVFMAVPRRADAFIPGIAAAAAALGVSEGALTATVAGLLTAGGVVILSDEGRQKAVAAAWEGASEHTRQLIANAIGNSDGQSISIDIDGQCAADIWEMMRAMESGEEIEFQVTGNEMLFYVPFGSIVLDGQPGIINCIADWSMDPDAGHDLYLFIRGNNRVRDSWSGLRIYSSSVDKIYSASGQHEIHIDYKVYSEKAVVASGNVATVLCGSEHSFHWNVPETYVGEHTFGAAVLDGTASVFVDGEMVYNWPSVDSSYGIRQLDGTGDSSVQIPFLYSLDYVSVGTLTPGIDYTPSNLTENQVGALGGTTIDVPLDGTAAGNPTINPPVTWPEATDLTGIMGALQNLWNTIVQGFNAVKAYLAQIVASISTPMDPNVLLEPINNLKGFIVGKVPELADLDMSGFVEREWDWTVSINYPFAITFQVLDSEMLERARPTIKGFTSGILILLTTIYAYKRIPEIVNK